MYTYCLLLAIILFLLVALRRKYVVIRDLTEKLEFRRLAIMKHCLNQQYLIEENIITAKTIKESVEFDLKVYCNPPVY